MDTTDGGGCRDSEGEAVIAAATVNGSICGGSTHDDDIIAVAATDDVGAALAVNGVVVAQSDDGISTGSTNQSVGGVGTKNRVVTSAHWGVALCGG